MAGVAVFAMWFVLARWQHLDGSALAGQLQALAPWQRLGWIAVRAVTAVVVVPIAEELAFRGYLARRLMSADVEDVPLKSLTVVAIVVSSLVFGAMHGHMWLAGAVAGMVFAWVAKKRNRLGEAVAAHATANLLIALWVFCSGDFGMW
jgi:CAAX prenyl protease-like protein